MIGGTVMHTVLCEELRAYVVHVALQTIDGTTLTEFVEAAAAAMWERRDAWLNLDTVKRFEVERQVVRAVADQPEFRDAIRLPTAATEE